MHDTTRGQSMSENKIDNTTGGQFNHMTLHAGVLKVLSQSIGQKMMDDTINPITNPNKDCDAPPDTQSNCE